MGKDKEMTNDKEKSEKKHDKLYYREDNCVVQNVQFRMFSSECSVQNVQFSCKLHILHK